MSNVRQSQIERAIRACKREAVDIERIEIDRDGKIIVFAKGAATDGSARDASTVVTDRLAAMRGQPSRDAH